MQLHNEIKEFKEKAFANIPPEIIKTMTKAANELAESNILNRALATGERVPPFSLPNVHGQLTSSAELLSRGPLAISFYRGSW